MSKLMAAAAIGLAGFGAQQADASLIIDVRQTGAAFGAGKQVQVLPGGSAEMQVWAVLDGADTNLANDDIANAMGNFVSTGGMLGNLAATLSGGAFGGLVGNFASPGSQPGVVQDLDGDTDLDIGSPMSGALRDVKAFFNARAASRQNPSNTIALAPALAHVIDATSSEILLGTLTFTAAGDATGETLVNFVNRLTDALGPDAAAAVWTDDGVNSNPTVAGAVYTAGAPVQISLIPEPTGLALAGLAGLGFLARRRTAK